MDIYDIDPKTKDLIFKKTEAPRYENLQHQRGYYPAEPWVGIDYKMFRDSDIKFSQQGYDSYLAVIFGRHGLSANYLKSHEDKETQTMITEVKA